MVQKRPDFGPIKPFRDTRASLWRSWRKLRISGRFFVAAAALFLVLSLVSGILQTQWTISNLKQGSGDVISDFVQERIAPYITELTSERGVSSRTRQELDEMFKEWRRAPQHEAIRILSVEGAELYSSAPGPARQLRHEIDLVRAAQGKVVVTYDDEVPAENVSAKDDGRRIGYVLFPIFGTPGSVVAVGEFHGDFVKFHERSGSIIAGSWAIRLAITLFTIVFLFLLVRYSARPLELQQRKRVSQYRLARRLANQNSILRQRAEEIRKEAVKVNEHLLSRVGAEIHDGPVQLLSLAMLKAPPSSIPENDPGREAQDQWSFIPLLREAITQLRQLSLGLVLPEIGELTSDEAIRLAVARHEHVTGTSVETEIADLPASVSEALKTCLYRLVQEGLANAARHAGGKGQRVTVRCADSTITLTISDQGPGMPSTISDPDRPRLGIVGARNRVAAFGGSLVIESRQSEGTTLIATLPVQ